MIVEKLLQANEEIRRFCKAVCAWLLVFLATTIFAADLWNYLFILSDLVILGVWIWGCVLGVRAISILARNQHSKLPAFALAGLLGLAVLYFTGIWSQVMAWPRFFLGWPFYQTNISRINRAPDRAAKMELCTRSCRLELDENGRPEQVAFLLTGVDVVLGCEGFVYDYSGKMQRSERKHIGRLPVLKARHLIGPWYVCHFWHD